MCRFDGALTDGILKEFYRDAGKVVARIDPQGTVTDFAGVTRVEVARQTILELAKSPPALPDPKLPRVIVAPSPVMFGLSRMFEMEGEATRPSLYVVSTEREAWAILGVQEPQFKPIKE